MASIEIDEMARLVRGMENVAEHLPAIRNEFNKTLARFTLPTHGTAPMLDVAG